MTTTTTHSHTATGASGRVYCTDCLVSAATVAELDAKPCMADYYED
jgi:hypothetical protein